MPMKGGTAKRNRAEEYPVCDSIAEGGQRCSGKHPERHDAAYWSAYRARRRAQYAANHPPKGGHGRKPLPADAGAPKRKQPKLNLGAKAGMMVDLSRGLALGEVPAGHPSKAELDVANAGVQARWAIPGGGATTAELEAAEARMLNRPRHLPVTGTRKAKITPAPVKVAEPTKTMPMTGASPASPTQFPVTVTRIAPKTAGTTPATAAVGELELAALTEAEAEAEAMAGWRRRRQAERDAVLASKGGDVAADD